MNTIQIIVVVIFVLFIITYLVLIGNLDLTVNFQDPLVEECDTVANSDEKINCVFTKVSTLADKRTSDINTINIIGVIVGILLGVIQMQYVNKLEMNNTLKIVVHAVLLTIYITLLGFGGSTYQDYYSIAPNIMAGSMGKSMGKVNKINDSAKWLVAIKPLIPFLCALSISSIGIIVEALSVSKNTNYGKILSSTSDSSPITSSE